MPTSGGAIVGDRTARAQQPMSGPPHAAEQPTDAGGLLVPITLELSPIRRLLIIDISDDPTYRTLEPQILDGPDGDQLVLLAYRHDDHVELYTPSGCDVDPSGYDGLGKGLDGIHRTEFDAARFEVTDDGLQLDLVVAAPNGRRFDLRIHEHLAGPRDRFPVLAPVGGTFATPAFFPFLWLPGMSFVPVRGTEVDVRVDDQARTVPRLPLPIGGRRCFMARYDPDVLVCQLNPDSVRVPARVPTQQAGGGTADPGIDVVAVDGGHGVAAVRVARGGHTCAAVLDPPLPDLRSLPVPTRRSGAILLQADHSTELRGRYEVSRATDRIDLVIEDFGPWRTRLRRPLLALLFHLPIFRRWPTTYRWQASLDVSTTPGELLSSRWTRSSKP
jgi:hypothetical protein